MTGYILETVCQGSPDKPDRPNEDAFIALQRDDAQPRFVLGAIDGATSLESYGALAYYLQRERKGISPAGLAASVARDSILAQVTQASGFADFDPRQLILNANQALAMLLQEVAPGIYDWQAILQQEPHRADILNDPRKIRLFLPAAVITLVTIDTDVNLLRYAHAGDTALLLAYEDGRVLVPTHNQVMNYETALHRAQQSVLQKGQSMLDALNDPLVRSLDRDYRIYHNYVDENGQSQPGSGTGVINGLPELADYIQTDLISLEGVMLVVLFSDGALWPAPLLETPLAQQKRFEMMATRLREEGVARYLKALREEERADASREKYPRFKLHDDATAVVLTRFD